jgi:hypothetical protein
LQISTLVSQVGILIALGNNKKKGTNMPRSETTFSPSQVRTRLRRALREQTGRGGGISLRALHVVNWNANINLATSDGTEIQTFNTNYYSMSGRAVVNVCLISQALQDPLKLQVNRLWHIAVMHGRDIERAKVYTVWIGNHETPALLLPGFGGGWLCEVGTDNLLPRCLMQDARAQWDNLLTTRSSSSPTEDENEM